jgi:hypothetical protein
MPAMRRLITFCSAVSLALCVVVFIAWVVSIFRSDSIGWAGFDDRAAGTWHNWGLTSDGGQLIVYRLNTGTVRLDGPIKNLSGINVPGMQPHVFHHTYRGEFGWRSRPVVYKDFPEGGPVPGGSPLRFRFVAVANWLLVLLFAAGGAPVGIRWLKRLLTRRRFAAGLCRKCGYDLRASPQRCPECGVVPV